MEDMPRTEFLIAQASYFAARQFKKDDKEKKRLIVDGLKLWY